MQPAVLHIMHTLTMQHILALHSHGSLPLPPAAQVVGLVPRAALPMVAADNNVDVIKRDVEHQLQVDAAENPDDKNNNYKLDDLPNEGMEMKKT